MSGDRSYVVLHVLAAHKERAEELFDGDTAEEDYPLVPDLHAFCFSEVRGGTLDFLNELVKAGIPFDSTWDAASDYGPGTSSCRFTPEGESIEKELYDDNLGADIDTLVEKLDDPQALREYILSQAERISVLSWDDQEEYSKRFQALQLILS